MAGSLLSVAAEDGRTPQPKIEKAAKGDRCVEDTQFMRENHMKLLNHQRDRTVHQGIRTAQHSLKGCVECHASRKTGSVATSDENFCQACHSYAAVKIDCFECHASKPAAATRQSLAPVSTGVRQVAALTRARP